MRDREPEPTPLNRPALTIARFTLLEARRTRLLWVLLVLLGAGFALAEFLGEVAITETREFQSGFLGALLRLGGVFLVALFVSTSMVREFNDKGLELVLSLPIGRATYLLGRLAGFAAVAAVTAGLCAASLLLYAPAGQVLLWGVSLACELLLVTVFTVLCLLTFSQVTAALSAVLAFYVLARAMAALQLMAHGPLVDPDSLAQQWIGHLLEGLAFLLPALDRFTDSAWLVHHTGAAADLLPIAGQTAVYAVLLGGAALFDLYRKSL